VGDLTVVITLDNGLIVDPPHFPAPAENPVLLLNP
jgi:hypothetical protein